MDETMTAARQTRTYAEPVYEEISPDLQILSDFVAALATDNDQEIGRLRKLIPAAPEPLIAMKQCFGAEYVREKGYRTDLAEERYGHGWLDR